MNKTILIPCLAAMWLAVSAVGCHASDLPMFGLKGAVKTLVVEYSEPEMQWETAYEFDQQGRLTAVDNLPVEVKRDDSGRITRYDNEDEDEDGEIVTMVIKLEYDADGHVVKTVSTIEEDNWIDTYAYNPEGRLTFHRSEGPDEEGEDLVLEHNYTYQPDADSQGNWLTRTEQLTEPGEPPVKQTRRITYY